jgi:DNA-binding response OmpR family regulator
VRILVVEDDRKVAGFLEQGLREERFEVDVAHMGDVGLERATSGDYALIVLDYMLPVHSGPEIAAAVRQRGIQTPILMLTARDDSRDVATALQAGVTAYLTKPFRFDDLIRQIGALLPNNPHTA